MCISCDRYAAFLTIWKTIFVQCSYAVAAVLAQAIIIPAFADRPGCCRHSVPSTQRSKAR